MPCKTERVGSLRREMSCKTRTRELVDNGAYLCMNTLFRRVPRWGQHLLANSFLPDEASEEVPNGIGIRTVFVFSILFADKTQAIGLCIELHVFFCEQCSFVRGIDLFK